MNIKIFPSKLSGELPAISSKSHIHRLLIAAALSENSCEIYFNQSSNDIYATKDCLMAMGADIIEYKDKFLVNPIKKNKNNILLPCKESGSTLRFLLPVIGALGIAGDFKTEGNLAMRPLSPLKEELSQNGMSISQRCNIIHTENMLNSGNFILPGNISSQFVTGLLFALPLLSDDSKITITSPMESKSYIGLTLSVLKAFGINIIKIENGFYIKGKQKYIAPNKIYSEGDWSNSAFWLTMGGFSEKGIDCTGINSRSIQGDREILNILKSFGAKVEVYENKITVKQNKLQGIKINCCQTPDIAPEIAVLGALAEGKTVVCGAQRLRIKECDRIKAICLCLENLGADITEKTDGFIINGRNTLRGGVVNSFNDHRIAMMCAVLSSKCENPVIIQNAEAVNKSYPNFFSDFIKLGGKIEKEG